MISSHLPGSGARWPASGEGADPAPAPPPLAEDASALAETPYADWRLRLARNLSRPSYRRWDPLTFRESLGLVDGGPDRS